MWTSSASILLSKKEGYNSKMFSGFILYAIQIYQRKYRTIYQCFNRDVACNVSTR